MIQLWKFGRLPREQKGCHVHTRPYKVEDSGEVFCNGATRGGNTIQLQAETLELLSRASEAHVLQQPSFGACCSANFEAVNMTSGG